MKFDVLSIVVAIFTVGVLASSFNLSEVLASEVESPSALQQGIPLK